MSEVVAFRSAADRAREAGRVAAHLRRDGLVLYPTETVYGLGSTLREPALERLAALKGRAGDRPFLLLITDPAQVPGLEWTEAARALAAAFWPGPLTLALRARPGAYPARVVGPGGTVAVRHSPHPAAQALVNVLGEPITSTSANRPGEAPATGTDEALALLRDLGRPSDLWLVDGGTLPASLPSTIVDCSGTRPRVIRAGAVAVESLRTHLNELDD